MSSGVAGKSSTCVNGLYGIWQPNRSGLPTHSVVGRALWGGLGPPRLDSSASRADLRSAPTANPRLGCRSPREPIRQKLDDAPTDFRERPGDTRPGGPFVSPAAEGLCEGGDVNVRAGFASQERVLNPPHPARSPRGGEGS